MLKLSELGQVHHVQMKFPFLAYGGSRLQSRQTVKNHLLRCPLFFSFLFLILCIQVLFDEPNNKLKTQRVMAGPSSSTERTIFGLRRMEALKPSDGKTSTIVMYLIL